MTNKTEEEDLTEKFKEEINKPYYSVFYLDDFKLPYEKLDVSVVIATYNRCPYKPNTLKESHNPLVWAIKTALYQKPKIKEIIIADDNSQDYTKQIVEKLAVYAEKEFGTLVKYVKSKKRLGPGGIRNLGSKIATSKYLFFIDDDCFIAPYSAFGAVYVYEKIAAQGIKVGLINLPTYPRSTLPVSMAPKKDIGLLDFIKGIYKANKGAFPEEYLTAKPEEKFIDSELHILQPFQIHNVNTTSLLCPKAVFEEVGGFPEGPLKRMEDRDFGCKVIENGYSVYFCPDIKFQCVHGSYGLHTGVKLSGEDWFKKIDKSITIKQAMDVCDKPSEDQGARISPEEYIYQSIMSFFIMTYLRNKKGAMKWIKKVYNEFVVNGETALFGNAKLPVAKAEEREKIWMNAINEGLRFIKQEQKEELRKIDGTINELKKKQKSGEKAIPLLEKLG